MSSTELLSEIEQMTNFLKEQKFAHVIVSGPVGAGKSTLINTLFQEELAQTNEEISERIGIKSFQKEGYNLTIWDTIGFDYNEYQNFKMHIEDFIKDRSASLDPNQFIFLSLYCIPEQSLKFQKPDKKICKLFNEYKIPIIIVLTKCLNDNGLKKSIKAKVPYVKKVIRIRALETVNQENFENLPVMGLLNLVQEMYSQIERFRPHLIQKAQDNFINLVNDKKCECMEIVDNFSREASFAFKDFIPFVRGSRKNKLQIEMISQISQRFSANLDSKSIKKIVKNIFDSIDKHWYQTKIFQFSSSVLSIVLGGLTIASGIGIGVAAIGGTIGIATTTAAAVTSGVTTVGGLSDKVTSAKKDEITYIIGLVYVECLSTLCIQGNTFILTADQIISEVCILIKEVYEKSKHLIKE